MSCVREGQGKGESTSNSGKGEKGFGIQWSEGGNYLTVDWRGRCCSEVVASLQGLVASLQGICLAALFLLQKKCRALLWMTDVKCCNQVAAREPAQLSQKNWAECRALSDYQKRNSTALTPGPFLGSEMPSIRQILSRCVPR